MLKLILNRIASTIPTFLLVSFFIFSLLFFAPGDPAVTIGGDTATQEDIDRIRRALNLDQPFFTQFATWFWAVVHGDLGRSMFSNVPVTDLIVQRLEPTLLLMAMTMVFAVSVGIPLGVLAGWKRGTWVDRLVMTVAVFGFSVPVFVTGYALAFGFGVKLRWLPVQGYVPLSQSVPEAVRYLLLPSVALGSFYIAIIARMTRATMIEVLSQDYIRTARAKGLGEFSVLFVHALKNAAGPIATVVGIGVAMLIGGSVVIESVFSIPGIGRLTIDAILRRDYPVIQGIVVMFSILYVFINLLVDLMYMILDPRIRY